MQKITRKQNISPQKGKADRRNNGMSRQLERELDRIMKALHREWERCGVPVKEIYLMPEDAEKIAGLALEKIRMQQERLEKYEERFSTSLNMSKENFVLLRVLKKLQRAAGGKKSDTGEKAAEGKENRKNPCISLDREEYRVFLELVSWDEKISFWERRAD
jgi:hypothetical protein